MNYFESFEKTTKILKTLFQGLLKNEVASILLQVVDNVEEHQEYLWKYID